MNRIDAKFKELKAKNEKAMISFITAGDPDFETTAELVYSMEKAGADIIELGVPYSDPIADGPTIQKSSARSLKHGTTILKIMNCVKSIRSNTEVPLVYLVYYNSVFKYGIEKFISQCREVGIDGIIIPDLPIEERKDILKITDKYEVALIPLIAPTSKERIKKIVSNASGFIYCVSSNGVTGARSEISTNMDEYMGIVSNCTDIPKAIGFGISNAKMAENLKKYCDGIIIGSAIVKKVDEIEDREEMLENVKAFVKSVKAVL
ncbi:tryptophan synthase subunit alpha [Clostridium tyrobutyricum]|jgi:tryptophan synthase alpha chain|uniref:Tryptophan synthase alpha chain n=2 Tax=Clostridium tyrobutyricum TaxID=1519 RepID=W6N3J5_CLOTY|nr:tryptophan synthase subunit alpha [Clostridium tyrobutyricum]AND84819.1 tryptophan synthase alpha chain [Clostridium tyrobutyricum]ANP69402.1 tryptophan synthase subunit alpha [Clostridium tyrobutyricum]MBV4422058.1 tryptophan synthase subunit alpha [Clostridium tyrobutyricum]MBV4428101.1 tryptophan synthase subunit alpha [Clostridium tyrobutyricum]MBV4434214.1 tryptophan synthase subunit alpha [Clostridium tyrobutyricum]